MKSRKYTCTKYNEWYFMTKCVMSKYHLHDTMLNDYILNFTYCDNDIIVHGSSCTLYLDRRKYKAYIIDNIENIQTLLHYKNHIVYCCGINGIGQIQIGLDKYFLEHSTFLLCDLKDKFLFTYNGLTGKYNIFTIDLDNYTTLQHNIKLYFSFCPFDMISKHIYLNQDSETQLFDVIKYYDNIQRVLLICLILQIHSVVYLIRFEILENGNSENYKTKKTIYLKNLNKDEHIDNIFFISKTKLCLITNTHKHVFDIFHYDLKSIQVETYENYICTTKYLSIFDMMYIITVDTFYMIPNRKMNYFINNKLELNKLKLECEKENTFYNDIIIGNYTDIVPHISQCQCYIFYIYNQSICILEIGYPHKFFISDYTIPEDIIIVDMFYFKEKGLLLSTNDGKIIELSVLFH